jgi:O-antigen/teichoic acid export membrane protein
MTTARPAAAGVPLLLRQASWVLGTNVLALAAALVTNIIYARVLGPEGLGWYTLVLYFPEMAALVLNFGLSFANVYLVGSGRLTGQEAFAASMGSALVLAVAGGLAYGITLPWLQPAVLKGVPGGLALVGILALPLGLMTNHADSFFQVQERFKEQGLVKVGQRLLCLALVLGLVVGLGLGAWGAVLGYLAAGWAALGLLCLRLAATLKLGVGLPRAVLRQQLSFGLKGHLGLIMNYLNYRLDILLVAYFLTPREVGLYTLATVVAEVLWQGANAAQTALYPRISKAAADTAVTLELLTGVVGLTALGGLGLLVLGRPLIIWCFSAAFVESYLVIVLLLPGILAFCYAKILVSHLVGQGQAWAITAGAAAGLPLTLGLNLLLIPRLGIQGAAIASSLSYTASSLVLAAMFLHYSGATARELLCTMNPRNWWQWGASLLRGRRGVTGNAA